MTREQRGLGTLREGQPLGSLGAAGLGSGGFLPVISVSDGTGQSSTSATYDVVIASGVELKFTWDEVFPDTSPRRWKVWLETTDGGDQIDVRLRNNTDGENVFEALDVGNSGQQSQLLADTTYAPTTTATPAQYWFQIKNSDGMTSIGVDTPTVMVGYDL